MSAYDSYKLIEPYHDNRYVATFQEGYAARVLGVYGKLERNGIDLDDFDVALLCLRIDQGRADIANPHGITPERARAMFKEIMAGYSQPARLAFREAIRSRVALRNEFVVRPLVDLRAFNDDVNNLLLRNNSYVKVEKSNAGEPRISELEMLMRAHYGEACGRVIMRQFGWLGDVKSPAAATLEGDFKTISFIKKQQALRVLERVALDTNVGKVADTETIWGQDGSFRGRAPKIIDTDTVKTLVIFDNGQARGVYVPAYLAAPILHSGAGSMSALVEGFGKVNYAVKSTLVQYNFAAWPVLHIRDILHELRAVCVDGGVLSGIKKSLGLLSKFPKAYQAAFSGWQGKPNETYLNALDRGLVVSRRERYMAMRPI